MSLPTGAGTKGAKLLLEVLTGNPGQRSLIPLHMEGGATGHGLPGGLGQHGHSLGDLDHLLHTGDRQGRSGIKIPNGATEHRTPGQHSDQGTFRFPDVAPVPDLTGDLPLQIEPGHRPADQPEFTWPLERHPIGNREQAGRSGDGPVVEASS